MGRMICKTPRGRKAGCMYGNHCCPSAEHSQEYVSTHDTCDEATDECQRLYSADHPGACVIGKDV